MKQRGGFYSKIINEYIKKWKDFHLFKNDCCPCVFKFLGMEENAAEELRSIVGNSGMEKDEIENAFSKSFPNYDFDFQKVLSITDDNKKNIKFLRRVFARIPKSFGIVSGYLKSMRRSMNEVGGHCIVLTKDDNDDPYLFDVQKTKIIKGYSNILQFYKKENAQHIFILTSKHKDTKKPLYFDRYEKGIRSKPYSKKMMRKPTRTRNKKRSEKRRTQYKKFNKTISNKSKNRRKQLNKQKQKRKTMRTRKLRRRRGIKSKSSKSKSKRDTVMKPVSIDTDDLTLRLQNLNLNEDVDMETINKNEDISME